MKKKRLLALGMAILIGGMAITPNIYRIYAGTQTAQAGSNVFWNTAMGAYPGDYYGKTGRKYFGFLRVDGKAAICLDSVKALNTGKTGTIAAYNFDGTTQFATGISRAGAEMLSYAMIMGGGGNGQPITDNRYYILCQCLCWMIEGKGGNVSWEDLEEWKVKTKDLARYLVAPYNTALQELIDRYCEEATRMLRPEAVASFMSKYPNEAPILELDYNEEKGIYEKDFELIDFLDATAAGFDQVWMQYFLDYDTAIKQLEAEGKIDPGTLKMEHMADGGRNWLHVEYSGDIEKLKSCGPIPLHFEEGTDGAKYTYGLQNLSIWTPDDSGQQHLLADVAYGPWTVYINFGGQKTPTPTPESGEGSYEVIVNTHKHEETFTSNYNIELYKYDYETGEPLENSEFEILERMDLSQFDDSVDHNGGNPAGTYPLDDLNFDKFSQVKYDTEKPTEEWQVCGTFTTDENGLIEHTDTFNYDFTATYCDGHPDPEIEYIECDHEADEDCDCDEKNEQLEEEAWAAWQKAVDECAARTNFHAIEEGAGKAACEEYRDSVWDAFINLDYQYTAREKTARSGYILHDIHTDDNPIEIVEFNASEANDSGDYSKTTGKYSGNNPENPGIDFNITKTVSSTVNDTEEETLNDTESISTASVRETLSSGKIENSDMTDSKYRQVKAATKSEADNFIFEDEDTLIEDDVATPSNAVLRFNAIETLSNDEEDGESGGDLHCTWNDVKWTFDGDPEPEFGESEMENVDYDSYIHDNVAHVFHVYDHRTEGEIHINKRDLDLESYADANGDGSLEGAVYGLFAAEDIIHPDGKTGVVYEANDLVSIATTDRNGDASFITITEEPGTHYNYETGEIEFTEWNENAPDNLFNQDITTELMNNGINIDLRTYYDNLNNNGNTWIGRPLILGRYYVKELSRSEGYELSITGSNQDITNYGTDEGIAVESTGYTRFNGYKADDQYGDNQDYVLRFDITYGNTGDGYDITISGYPEGTKFYSEKPIIVEKEEEVVVGSHIEITDTPILAEEGEYKLDEDGKKIPLLDENGDQVYGTEALTGTLYPTTRNNDYPNGEAVISDEDQYNSSDIDLDFIKSEGQSILKQIGYVGSSKVNAMPWKVITVNGDTNGEIIENLINELRENTFYDSYIIDNVSQNGGEYEFIIRYGYLYSKAYAVMHDGTLYVRKTCTNVLTDGSEVDGYYYIEYGPDEYTQNGNGYEVEIKVIDGNAIYGEPYVFVNQYEPLYETYKAGEQKYGMMLQEDGSYVYGPLFETKVVQDTETVTFETEDYELTELNATYKDGIYTLHIDTSDVDWETSGEQTDSFRIIIPEDADKTTIKQNSTIAPSPEIEEIEAGSYIEYKTLTYNSQNDVYSGDETITQPIRVYERPIRQRIKVQKDIQTNPDGNYENDTYSEVHSENLSADEYNRWYDKAIDWLTSLINGDDGENSTSVLPNFRFKAYLKSNLERLYRDNDGNITWLDRNGNVLIPEYKDTNNDGNYDTFTWESGTESIDFPEKNQINENSLYSSNVQKIYTEVEHNITSTTTGDIANNTWAEYADPQTGETTNVGSLRGYNTSQDGDNGEAININDSLYSYKDKNINVAESDKINEKQNQGYTRLLETTVNTVEDGAGATREVEQYNYEKFFDAIAAANTDKWDNDMYASTQNYPGQHWFDTFEERYQMDDADEDGTLANVDKTDADGTAGGDRDTSFKPFQWIREQFFGTTEDAKNNYPATHDNENLENIINTSDKAHSNAEASDAIRQFAIKWYLDDEVAKLVRNNGYDEDVAQDVYMDYQEQVYDEALFNALEKAYNYLKPFYNNDLDTIYSVEWDTAENGGKDGDFTTLSADTLYNEDYYYGVSAYLPYGTYVIVEQQPYTDSLDDFKNKHFKTDKPKEVILPAVYEEDGNLESPEIFDDYYNYNSSDTPEQLAEKYLIRFNEEWADNHTDDLRNYVIRAHNYDGNFEVYKYGLDVDKLVDTITYDGGSYDYAGFNIIQDEYDPLKNYYNDPLVDTAHEGGNSNAHYKADDQNKGIITANRTHYRDDAIEKRYHYGSISENFGIANNVIYQHGTATDDNNPSGFYFKDKVNTMTGNQTAYEGKYASMLVPWTVAEPVDAGSYNSDEFNGFADTKFRNTFYTTKLRIEKLDSETGEQILHDDVIFSIYAASRYTSQAEIEAAGAPERTEIGDVKYYMEDTLITGSKEFLEAMNAINIEPIKRGSDNLYSGTVSAGTPVCLEEEQIIMTDNLGNKTGTFKVYTSMADLEMLNEEDGNKSFKDQNVGYLITPEPLGAGVYVVAETKAPAGYAKSKPIAVEVYSDGVTYYMNGLMDSQVEATIYQSNLID